MKTIRLADIKPNDVLNGEGVCVSIWLQGCPHHCPGCHNPETWDFDGGKLYYQQDVITQTIRLLGENGIKRNLSILGGEPLCDENEEFVRKLAAAAHNAYPECKIFCWTGSTLESLEKKYKTDILLENIDILIDGPYIKEQRDITLHLRGSANQKIRYKGIDF